ncbi:PLDc_N domain-containing protein [Pontibacter sp. Tf4]|uniref:PLD nuclease N-terminal domain-containing protein n=1 Tax=Pontibacter sp. Tf4 TaxID=2761620 RepID=UPI001628B5FC|nr:PLD nuclease N-terminal domain-containing protein [Pontibacter sp. Tf4]MBB6609960.1 PLDc_N domain-containing protein [Pontibacter sp. Tf4]
MPETTLLFIGGLAAQELLFILLFFAVPFGLWLGALIDLLRSNFTDSITKLIWLVTIIFVPVLGAILYLLIGRKQKVKTVKL